MNLIDCHTHTRFSMDSNADVNDMLQRAAELGLAAYAVTDHCECNAWYNEEHYADRSNLDYFGYAEDFENSVSAITAMKENHSEINLICGTEMGQAMHELDIAERIVSDKRLDFVIASVHQIKGEKDFYYIDYEKMSMNEIYDLLEKYFNEVYELCRWGKFDVLGHLTYCIRYMKKRSGISPDLSRFDEVIAESFRALAANGKGIEINTSGLRQGVGETFPGLKYIKLFKDLGGEIISVGSDAHNADDLGSGIADGARLALEAGFKHLCYFKQRKPVFMEI